jgi:protein-tyrosine-phosphatase
MSRKILFVCTGNTCRSPMAHAMFEKMCQDNGLADSYKVASAGFMGDGVPVSPQAVQALEAANVMPVKKTSTLLTDELVEEADLIVVMAAHHRESIVTRWPEASGKTQVLMSLLGKAEDVSDPVGMPVGAYKKCLSRMEPALQALMEQEMKLAE